MEGGDFVEGRNGGVRMALPGRSARAGADLVLGFRPQTLREQGAGPEIEITVRVVEPLGDTVDIHGTTAAGSAVVARIPPTGSVVPGQRARLRIDPAGIHLFEAGEFGRALA